MKLKPSTPPLLVPSFGRCIYCGDDSDPLSLTKEHVIPYALNGTLTIEKASCVTCQKHINETIENIVLQNDLLIPRLLLELKRRRKNKYKERPLPKAAWGNTTATPDGIYEAELELAQYPPVIVMLTLKPPGMLGNVDRGNDLHELKFQLGNIANSTTKFVDATVRTTGHHTQFSLLLAKIAYGFALAERGWDGFDGEAIRDLITGRRDDVYNFVGSADDSVKLKTPYLHGLSMLKKQGFWVVRVHLFAQFSMHPYEVVVGKPVLRIY